MSAVTSIKPQKLKNRVNIYLDGKFGFGIDLENYVKLGLKVGHELSDERVIEITQKAEFQKVMNRILVFTTLRPRSEKEINDWMLRKKVKEDFKGTLFQKLRKLELLDDEKFAKWWVGQRLQFKSKSSRELVAELKNKGINKVIIEEVIGELLGKDNEINSAKRLIEKNIYKWSRFPGKIARQKKQMFLARKGFAWETIKKVLDNSEQ